MLKAELLEELASPTIPFWRLAGDPGALQLIEGVAENSPHRTRRQPVGLSGSKTNLYVSNIGSIIRENHATDEIIVLIYNPDGLAWPPIQSMPDLVRYPLSDERGERAGD